MRDLISAWVGRDEKPHPLPPPPHPELLGSMQQRGTDNSFALLWQSSLLQKCKVFMLRKAWKLSVNASQGFICARDWNSGRK